MKHRMAILSATLLLAACGGERSEGAGSSGAAADWPAYGLDHANSVHELTETTISPENVAGLRESWRVDVGGVTGTPAVVDGVVYVADWHGVVRAMDADDGELVWEERLAEVPFSASVAVTDGLVVAGDLGGVLHAVDRATGDPVWSANVEPRGASLFASPVVIEDTVVIGMTDTELGPDDPGFRASVVALDIGDGSERWRLYTDPEDDGSGTWVSVWSSVAYDPGRGLLFVGTGDANQPGSGGPGSPSERARTDLPLANGVLAIEWESGRIAWFLKLVEAPGRDLDVGASPNLFTVGDRDVVGAGGKSGDYVVLDRDTGELIWKVHLTEGSAGGGVMSTAAVGDGVIYVASNAGGVTGIIFALDARDGSILWERELDGPVYGGSMALANGVLYRGTWGGTVMALDADDGAVLWTDDLDAPIGGGFSVADGTLYVGYGSGAPGGLGPVDGGLIAYRIP